MGNTTVGLQMNMRQLLNVLSSSLYKGDILSVATRELLQNSFDAVKKVSDPKIQVNFSNYERTLEFKDNGIGMSPETVKDVFLTIGGTAKEGLDETERSGGFGIAKVQFFTAAEHILVESIHILAELEIIVKLQVQVQRFLRGETKEVQFHTSIICSIISFMGQAKMYDPEVVLYLIGLTHG